LNPPEHVLSPIAADAEIGGLERLEVLLPDFLPGLAAPAVGNRVAQEQDVDSALLGDGDESLMPLLILGNRLDGAVVGFLVIRPGRHTGQDGETEDYDDT